MYKKQTTVSLFTYYSRQCTAVSAQVSQGLLLSAFKVGRVKRGRVHFCIFSSKSTSVLIYLHTEYSTQSCFVSLLKFSELYIIFKSHGRTVQKADYSVSRLMYYNILYTTTTAVSTDRSMVYTTMLLKLSRCKNCTMCCKWVVCSYGADGAARSPVGFLFPPQASSAVEK